MNPKTTNSCVHSFLSVKQSVISVERFSCSRLGKINSSSRDEGKLGIQNGKKESKADMSLRSQIKLKT